MEGGEKKDDRSMNLREKRRMGEGAMYGKRTRKAIERGRGKRSKGGRVNGFNTAREGKRRKEREGRLGTCSQFTPATPSSKTTICLGSLSLSVLGSLSLCVCVLGSISRSLSLCFRLSLSLSLAVLENHNLPRSRGYGQRHRVIRVMGSPSGSHPSHGQPIRAIQVLDSPSESPSLSAD